MALTDRHMLTSSSTLSARLLLLGNMAQFFFFFFFFVFIAFGSTWCRVTLGSGMDSGMPESSMNMMANLVFEFCAYEFNLSSAVQKATFVLWK
jgi:hypothetical protein